MDLWQLSGVSRWKALGTACCSSIAITTYITCNKMNNNYKNMTPRRKAWRLDMASTSAETSPQMEEATTSPGRDDKEGLLTDLIELKLHAKARINLLYRRRVAFGELLSKGVLLDLDVLRNILYTEISSYERRSLELCVLMLSLVHQRSIIADRDGPCDVSMEVCSVTTPEEMRYAEQREPVISILTLSSIWTIEAARGSNLAHLAYELLINIGNSCTNEHLQRYVEHVLTDSARWDDNEVYWSLRLVHSALLTNKINGDGMLKLLRTCIIIANIPDNTIYVNDIVADILARLWPYFPCDPNELPSRCRYSFMAKLLLTGVADERIVSTLITTAVSGDYTERKVALSALVRAQGTTDTGNHWDTFNVATVDPKSDDLGILSVAAAMLTDYDSAIIYLQHLYCRIGNILHMGEIPPNDVEHKLKTAIVNLVSREMNLPDDNSEHLCLAGSKYFIIRDILLAITGTYKRMQMLNDQSSLNKKSMTSTHDVDAQILLVLYLSSMRQEYMPYVAAIIDEINKQSAISTTYIRFCLETIREGKSGIFSDQFTVSICKVLNSVMKRWAFAHEGIQMMRYNEINSLTLDMVRSLRSVLATYGESVTKYRSSMHIASVLASLCVLLNIMPWNDVSMSLSNELSGALVQLMQGQPMPWKSSRYGPVQQYSEEDATHNNHKDVLQYTVAAFEMLCHIIVPPVKLIKMALRLVWDPQRATYVFNGINALLRTQHVGRNVVSLLIKYCLHARVHTDWGEEATMSFRRFITELTRVFKRKSYTQKYAKETLVVSYMPMFGWKARRRLEVQCHGRVKLNRSSNIIIFLRDFAMQLKEDIDELPVAVCRSVDLLDEHLCVPRVLMETKVHDCPGE